MKYLTLIALIFSAFSYAGSSDVGTISRLYVDSSGIMAIQLNNGFPNAVSSSQCPSSNGWAYLQPEAPTELKSVLLAAKATQSQVSISIWGCEPNGTSLILGAVYVD